MKKKQIRVIYVSGQITGGGKIKSRLKMKKNVMKAISIGYSLLKLGYYPIIPHLDYMFAWHPRAKNITWEEFLDWDLGVIRNCDAVYRIKGDSAGADIECRFAKRKHIPVFHSFKALQEADKNGK